MITIGSLFTGIGGIELGLERAGMQSAWQVERDPYCREVLATHWPDVARHDDVITFPAWWDEQGQPHADIITAGFPCQPFSFAGKQLGVHDPRWLWPETRDAIHLVGPRYVLLENVAALVRDSWAFGAVLRDLHTLGFDAEWATLRASDFGAPHPRERVYIVAYTPGVDRGTRDRLGQGGEWATPLTTRGLSGLAAHLRRRAARSWLEREPRVARLVDGVPNRVDRLRVLGNAVVPVITEHIGRLIIEHHALTTVAAA